MKKNKMKVDPNDHKNESVIVKVAKGLISATASLAIGAVLFVKGIKK